MCSQILLLPCSLLCLAKVSTINSVVFSRHCKFDKILTVNCEFLIDYTFANIYSFQSGNYKILVNFLWVIYV